MRLSCTSEATALRVLHRSKTRSLECDIPRHGPRPAFLRAGVLFALLVLSACNPSNPVTDPADTSRPRTPQFEDVAFQAFPHDFMWGVGTSAHQFEGGDVDSDWWHWEHTGHTRTGETSDVATDFWNRYEEDLDRAAALGVNTFRFSVSWARLYPRPGMDAPDPAAAAHYDAMIAAMRQRGLRPMITLHHFVMPQWLTAEDRWASGAAIDDFVALARMAAARWGHAIDWWITVNEPYVFAFHGWGHGIFPPGKFGAWNTGIQVFVNVMKAHAAAYRAIKQLDATDADGDGYASQVGVAQLIVPVTPLDPFNPIDRAAVTFVDVLGNRLWFDLNRSGVPWFAIPFGGIIAADPSVRDTLDFIGVNYYSRQVIHFDLLRGLLLDPDSTGQRDMLNHEFYPEGLYDALDIVSGYGLPLIITEHGVPDATDTLRQESLVAHLAVLSQFIQDRPDTPVLGYVHWALTDNFEWENGYWPRFGLYAVDYMTLTRTPRPSADLYARLITAAQGR